MTRELLYVMEVIHYCAINYLFHVMIMFAEGMMGIVSYILNFNMTHLEMLCCCHLSVHH